MRDIDCAAHSRGFTLMEVISTIALVGIVVLLIPNTMTGFQQATESNSKRVQAMLIAEAYLEANLSFPIPSEKVVYNGVGIPQFETVNICDGSAQLDYNECWIEVPKNIADVVGGFELEKSTRPNFPVANIMEITIKVAWTERGLKKNIVILTYGGTTW